MNVRLNSSSTFINVSNVQYGSLPDIMSVIEFFMYLNDFVNCPSIAYFSGDERCWYVFLTSSTSCVRQTAYGALFGHLVFLVYGMFALSCSIMMQSDSILQ